MLITSSSNEGIKLIKKIIKSSKERRNQGLYVVEGIRMFKEIPPDRIHKIYISEDCTKQYADVISGFSDDIINIVKKQIFDSMSDTGTPQGIMALVSICDYSINEVITDNSFVLIIEKLQDPGNLGTIIRTAEGAGVTGIIISNDSVDLYNPKVVRSTMGSIFRVPIYVSCDLKADIEFLKHNNVTIFGAHLQGDTFYDKNFKAPCGFLIGNEGNGLSREVSETADELLKIPMLGHVESLNAATSTAVISYEVLRQRNFS